MHRLFTSACLAFFLSAALPLLFPSVSTPAFACECGDQGCGKDSNGDTCSTK